MADAARKLPPAPQQEPAKKPSIVELMTKQAERADVEGFLLAADKYGDDFGRELADLKAGEHPLQRRARAR